MTQILDSLLSNLAATYSQGATEESKTHATLAVVQAVAKRPMKKLRVVDPAPNGAQPVVAPRVFCAVPAVGYYDAKGFIIALRQAKTRDEQIACIAGFRGYDAKKDFGSNEYLAKSQALRELHPSSNAPDSSVRISASIRGYVAGMPNEHAKRVMDLIGRHKLAIDSALDFEKVALASDAQELRDYNNALALLERERAANIEAQLTEMGE